MKLVNGIVGTPIPPDYEMLRAALLAAQATTPTAVAAQGAGPVATCPAAERTAALHDLLTVAVAAADDAVMLGHSFAPVVPGEGSAA